MRSEFDKKAQNWDCDPMKVERAEVVAKAIITSVPLHQHMTAFEFGCGTGLLGLNLRFCFEKILMADNSPEMLAVLNKKIETEKLGHIETQLLDFDKNQLPLEPFDVVFTLFTLHHMPDVLKTIRQFYQILKPGGFLCISDLEKEDGSFHGQGFTGHAGFETDELKKLIVSEGFRIHNTQHVYTIKKSMGETEKNYPVFLLNAQKLDL